MAARRARSHHPAASCDLPVPQRRAPESWRPRATCQHNPGRFSQTAEGCLLCPVASRPRLWSTVSGGSRPSGAPPARMEVFMSSQVDTVPDESDSEGPEAGVRAGMTVQAPVAQVWQHLISPDGTTALLGDG